MPPKRKGSVDAPNHAQFDNLPDAARARSLAEVKRLLNKGVDVNQGMTGHGTTALMWASANGHADMVDLLLAQEGVDVNQGRTDHGTTALMLASMYGRADVVAALLDAGADPNQRTTKGGTTALMWASKKGHADVVAALLDAGADPNQTRTTGGQTALTVASTDGARKLLAAAMAAEHERCTICLEDMEPEQDIVAPCACKCRFHASCILRWQKTQPGHRMKYDKGWAPPDCPNCREPCGRTGRRAARQRRQRRRSVGSGHIFR